MMVMLKPSWKPYLPFPWLLSYFLTLLLLFVIKSNNLFFAFLFTNVGNIQFFTLNNILKNLNECVCVCVLMVNLSHHCIYCLYEVSLSAKAFHNWGLWLNKKVYYDEITLTAVLYDSFFTCVSVKVGARKSMTVRNFMNDVNFDSLCHSEYGKKQTSLCSQSSCTKPNPCHTHTNTHLFPGYSKSF